MESKILSIMILACILSGAMSQLQCYNCLGDECQNLNDDKLSNCGPQSTSPSTPSTASTTPIPTDSSTSTSDSSTNSDATTTSISDSSTNSDTTTTSTATTTPSDTSTNSVPSSSSTSTTSMSESTTSSATTITSPGNIKSMRLRRSLPRNITFISQEGSQLSDFLRLRAARADSSYYCYSVSIPDGDSTKRKHGCVEVASGDKPCDAVRVQNNIPAKEDTDYGCFTCNTNKCNSAGYLAGIPFLALLVPMLLQILFK